MTLHVILPCYNEELVLESTTATLVKYFDNLISRQIIDEYSIIYIDDGSTDKSWQIIHDLNNTNKKVHAIKLAHNVGHQHALWAGYEFCDGKCDAVVSIDADLQHDYTKIEEMVFEYKHGFEVVLGIRNNRATDSLFKKYTALTFYKLMAFLGVDLIPNHADFRLLGQHALHALVSFPERNIFIRGLVRKIGFRTTNVYFDVKDRSAGQSKYTLSKMLNLALDGILSFSIRPLRLITLMGVLCLCFAAIETVYVFLAYLTGATIPGWSSILLSVWFIGAFLILSLGIIGEYIGKIYSEAKHRPLYIIEKTL